MLVGSELLNAEQCHRVHVLNVPCGIMCLGPHVTAAGRRRYEKKLATKFLRSISFAACMHDHHADG